MSKTNFSFLESHDAVLARLCTLAEGYCHTDPQAALNKLRVFTEEVVTRLYSHFKFGDSSNDNLFDRLEFEDFKKTVPPSVLGKLHMLRKTGNRGSHNDNVHSGLAIEALHQAYDVARWMVIIIWKEDTSKAKPFLVPEKNQIEEEARALQNRMTELERQLEQAQSAYEVSQQQVQQEKRDKAQLELLLQEAQQASNILEFNEEQTRRQLIDLELTEVGWEVSPQGKSNAQVSQEEEVVYEANPSGKGFADYVLYDDDLKPLAVIEAKKTCLDAEKGLEQARQYASGLEKKHGVRPLIYCTNGIDITLWDDAANESPRKTFGFYSKDSLQYRRHRLANKQLLDSMIHNTDIIDREYQIQALRDVTDLFSQSHRKALIVQATGTGKTRVAVGLVELLMRAGWVKRVLFLCDRRELRKQARNVFQEFLPGEPLKYVTQHTYKERNHRIYLATYPAMLKVHQSFDVGFFDLIIADESHRSIYNRYRELFRYFDARQVGLTATPVRFIDRNTFGLFDCENGIPTANYSFEDAVEKGYLVPFKVTDYTTEFLREGIKYREMTPEQQQELEAQVENPESIEYSKHQVDKVIFNSKTTHHVLRNLMDNGIMDPNGAHPGKSIIFARNHEHAKHLKIEFDNLFPQYGGQLCRIIDTYEPRAEELIDQFKQSNSHPYIVISVDMMDTGIDVPEIVNLVFAKPIRSYTKFWQMIGRGTRLCKNLFGNEAHKEYFQIFDHWGNFEFFEERGGEIGEQSSSAKPLLQQVFEARLKLANSAVAAQDAVAFDYALKGMLQDIAALPERTIAVREKRTLIEQLRSSDTLQRFDAQTQHLLQTEIAPLMRWRPIDYKIQAYKFDLLIEKFLEFRIQGASDMENLRDEAIRRIGELPITSNLVREQLPLINLVKQHVYWEESSLVDIDAMRKTLRGLMQPEPVFVRQPPKVIDIEEDPSEVIIQQRTVELESSQLQEYKEQIKEALKPFERHPVYIKIRRREPVTEKDLESLCSLVLTQNPDIDLRVLHDFFPSVSIALDQAIRSVIGVDPEHVREHFDQFINQHPLNGTQLRFIGLLKSHIERNGMISLERLYEPPFTSVAAEGVDELFSDEVIVNELMELILPFQQPSSQPLNS